MTEHDRKVACRAIALYAWWNDGEQQVGTTGRTLKRACADIMSGNEDIWIEVQDDDS